MKRLLALVAVGVALIPMRPAHADGSLPALPYRYLHPPPAFAANNLHPQSGRHSIAVTHGRSASAAAFTADGQAGIIEYLTNQNATSGAFAVPSGTRTIEVSIQPVDTPPGLSPQLAPDGNAYTITATAQPGNRPVGLAQRVALTLRWPLIPTGIYRYRNGTWSQLCSSDHALLAPSTITCPTTSLGTFVAVRLSLGPAAVPTPLPAKSGAGAVSKYIPLIAAVAVILVAAVLAFFIVRPRRTSRKR